MGTRNITCVFQNGEFKVAQYCQWDGDPEGQGQDILRFLKKSNLDLFKEYVKNVEFISDEKIKNLWVECGATPDCELVNIKVSNLFSMTYPHLHRDFGAEILDYIMETKGQIEVLNSIGFATDSLFCEWAYVVDLDRNKLVVYGNYQDPTIDYNHFKEFYDNYDGVVPMKSYDLDNLPNDEEFCQELESLSEEEY